MGDVLYVVGTDNHNESSESALQLRAALVAALYRTGLERRHQRVAQCRSREAAYSPESRHRFFDHFRTYENVALYRYDVGDLRTRPIFG